MFHETTRVNSSRVTPQLQVLRREPKNYTTSPLLLGIPKSRSRGENIKDTHLALKSDAEVFGSL